MAYNKVPFEIKFFDSEESTKSFFQQGGGGEGDVDGEESLEILNINVPETPNDSETQSLSSTNRIGKLYYSICFKFLSTSLFGIKLYVKRDAGDQIPAWLGSLLYCVVIIIITMYCSLIG